MLHIASQDCIAVSKFIMIEETSYDELYCIVSGEDNIASLE